MKKSGKKSIEILTHFQCSSCKKWWSIGDCDPKKQTWYCPWCGLAQQFQSLADDIINDYKKLPQITAQYRNSLTPFAVEPVWRYLCENIEKTR